MGPMAVFFETVSQAWDCIVDVSAVAIKSAPRKHTDCFQRKKELCEERRRSDSRVHYLNTSLKWYIELLQNRYTDECFAEVLQLFYVPFQELIDTLEPEGIFVNLGFSVTVLP